MGVRLIWVSNHGGRQLDHTQSTIDALPPIVDAVGDRADIVVDGGFARGTDVVKAVARGAKVCDSIVMHDSMIGRGASLERAIVDKQVNVGEGAKVGWGDDRVPNRVCPDHLSSGLALIGRGAQVPAGVRIGRNARIGARVSESEFDGDVPSGGVVEGPDAMH